MTKRSGRYLEFFYGGEIVGQVRTVGEIGSTRALVDASAYGEEWTDFVVGLQDGTEVALEIEYDPDDGQHVALEASYEAGEPDDFHVQFPPADWAKAIHGILTRRVFDSQRDGVWMLNLTLKILNPGVTDSTVSS